MLKSRNNIQIYRNDIQVSRNNIQISRNNIQISRNYIQLSRNKSPATNLLSLQHTCSYCMIDYWGTPRVFSYLAFKSLSLKIWGYEFFSHSWNISFIYGRKRGCQLFYKFTVVSQMLHWRSVPSTVYVMLRFFTSILRKLIVWFSLFSISDAFSVKL